MTGCKENHGRAGALYLHVPFCQAKCRYCDFYSVRLDERAAEEFVRAAGAELAANVGQLSLPLASAFVGGGTPTSLGPALMHRLLANLDGLVGQATELTVEANPGTVTADTAAALVRHGVNRVSIGAQSFQDDELRKLGRLHKPEHVAAAVSALRREGIQNISLDLIYGIPGQTADSWRRSLERAIGLGITHLSCYALSFEPGTPLHEDLAAGGIQPVSDAVQRECYDLAIEIAAEAGLEHYEISNFAAPGRQCRHNLTYWRNEPYLGIGPAAASFLQGTRRTNVADVGRYVRAVLAGQQAVANSETLDHRHRMAETVMLGLRMIEGVDRHAFSIRFGTDPVEAFASIRRYAGLGAIVITPSHVRLAREFLFVADTILADIVAEA